MNWKKIPNHENYEINEFGQVRFLGGYTPLSNGKKRYYPPRICKPIFSSTGYSISCDGYLVSIAKSVAVLFCENPNGYKQFYHIDGNIANNTAINIKWGLKERVILEKSANNLSEKEYLSLYYHVSADGVIIRKSDNKIFKPNVDAKGYLRVRIKSTAFSKNKDRRKVYKVHRLVAMFYLPEYSDKLQVNHINGNKKDNRVCNLEMVTARENVKHSWIYLDSTKRREILEKRRDRINGMFQ